LTDLEFTEHAADVSQWLPGEGRGADADRPDRRVGVPEGVDLDIPEYSIRSEMNDIETPAGKTWFMDLEGAVIDAGRCIQCGTCVASCSTDPIGVGEDGLPELIKLCTACTLCWDCCPRGGRRYERHWTITGGEDDVTGAGDPITEFSAKVKEESRAGSHEGGADSVILSTLLAEGELDGTFFATEPEEDPWKAEGFLPTSQRG